MALFSRDIFLDNHRNQSKKTWLPSIWNYQLHSTEEMSGNIFSNLKTDEVQFFKDFFDKMFIASFS